MPDYSEAFYRKYASRYAEVSHQYLQSTYVTTSHPLLKGDQDLHARLKELTNGTRGLDAGCGAGARDVFLFWQEGYDMWGVDVVAENVQIAHDLHPEIQDRVSVHDLRERLPFEDASFDFAMCNAVIQHIGRDAVHSVVLPEIARVLRPNGVFQLMFKSGEGVATVYDKDYDTERTFRLDTADELLSTLRQHKLELVEAEPGKLGGVLYFTDTKPMEHGVFYAKRR